MRRPCLVVVLTVVIPCAVSLIAYYGFVTNYTGMTFHEEGFRWQYESGVYKYRFLGRHITLGVYHFLKSGGPTARSIHRNLPAPPNGLLVVDRSPSKLFYEAYFLTNTFFHVLSAVMLYLVLCRTGLRDLSHLAVVHMVGVLLIGFTQYVVVPYDNLSYFLLLVSLYFVMRPVLYGVPLVLSIVCSTMARESSALALSFYFAYHFTSLRALRKRQVAELSAAAGAFLVTYVLLRVTFGTDQAIFQRPRVEGNFEGLLNPAGIGLFLAVSYALGAGARNARRVWIFLVAALPYLLMTFTVGVTWEARLWVPVWLPLMVLARDTSAGEEDTAEETDAERGARRKRAARPKAKRKS